MQPLKPVDQNAPGVYYKVYWRRKMTPNDDGTLPPPEPFKQEILEHLGNVGLYVTSIESQDFFYTLYEVKVQVSFSIFICWEEFVYDYYQVPVKTNEDKKYTAIFRAKF